MMVDLVSGKFRSQFYWVCGLIFSVSSSASDLVLPDRLTLPVLSSAAGAISVTSSEEVHFFATSKSRTVFVFLSSECPCSNSYLPELRRLSQKFAAAGVRFYGVHSNHREDERKARSYFKNADLNFLILDDHQQKLLNLLKAVKTPHAYVVRDQDRKIIYHGGVGSSQLANENMEHFLERALEQGDVPNPWQTKTLGCAIERKSD